MGQGQGHAGEGRCVVQGRGQVRRRLGKRRALFVALLTGVLAVRLGVALYT